MSTSAFTLNNTFYEGINLDELRLLAENTIILNDELNYPIHKKMRSYKIQFRKDIKINKKVNKIFKKIEKLKNKIAKLRGIKID